VKLNIYGTIWRIKYKWHLTDDNGHPAFGLCDKEKSIIWIARGLKSQEKRGTFLHELIHAINYELKICQTELNSEVEEIMTEGVADYLNKHLSEFMWIK